MTVKEVAERLVPARKGGLLTVEDMMTKYGSRPCAQGWFEYLKGGIPRDKVSSLRARMVWTV